MRRLVAAACALAAASAGAATDDALRADFLRLVQRVERLERENQQLRERLEHAPAPAAAPEPARAAAATERRLQALEAAQAETDKALASDRLSEREPELVTRLKAVEFQTLEMRKQAQQIEALEGVTVGASLVGVVQRVNAAGAANGQAHTRPNYRADVSVSLPGGSLGDIDGRLFAHFRLGQGAGVATRDAFAGLNGTAFQGPGTDSDATATLAQAWYQLTVPLPRGGLRNHSKAQLELNIGKMDPFVFFDQNAAADDESTRFINSVFVHNPLLDAGGDIGADDHGFAPGVRMAYVAQPERALRWGASLGVFAAGPGAGFADSMGQPLVIGQLEFSGKPLVGLAGNYRLYAWRNGQATDADGSSAHHTGVGLSLDQRVGDDWTVFGRYGHQVSGHPRFDRALTLGLESNGSDWGRGADGVGLGLGWLRSAAPYRAASGADAGELVAELYYRWQLNNRVQVSPDFQWIGRPAGQSSAPAIRSLGLRMKVAL